MLHTDATRSGWSARSRAGREYPGASEVGTLPPSNARRGRPRGVSTGVSRLRHQVEQLKREVTQL